MNKLYIKRLEDVRKSDLFQAGCKGSVLGELSTRFPVPKAFVIKVVGYRHFLEETGIEAELHGILDALQMDDPSSVSRGSKNIQGLFEKAKFPKRLGEEVSRALSGFGKVAVRCSPTIEGMDGSGRHPSFLNVSGERKVLEAIKGCFASLYIPEAITFRESNHFVHREAFMAVIVQEMIVPVFAGTVFTVDPVNRRYVLIEVVEEKERPPSHVILPNTYFLGRENGAPRDMSEHFIFDHKALDKLFRLGLQAERHLGSPQELSFAIDGDGRISLLGCRPVKK